MFRMFAVTGDVLADRFGLAMRRLRALTVPKVTRCGAILRELKRADGGAGCGLIGRLQPCGDTSTDRRL